MEAYYYPAAWLGFTVLYGMPSGLPYYVCDMPVLVPGTLKICNNSFESNLLTHEKLFMYKKSGSGNSHV